MKNSNTTIMLIVTVVVLLGFNLYQYVQKEDLKDAKMDSVSKERVEKALKRVSEIEKENRVLLDSIASKEALIEELRSRKPKRTVRYEEIYTRLPYLSIYQQDSVHADRINYLESLRRKRFHK